VKKKLFKNKGFTLIELLVTIVIMVSILSLAIVSYSKISDFQKENVKDDIKQSIIVAAKEFFEANEYEFDAMNEGDTKYIHLEELVENGYLTVQNNPTDSKLFDKCFGVAVEKKGNKYEYSFNEDASKCYIRNAESFTVVDSETGKKAKVDVDQSCEREGSFAENGTKWCQKNVIHNVTVKCIKGKGNDFSEDKLVPCDGTFKIDDIQNSDLVSPDDKILEGKYEYSQESKSLNNIKYEYCFDKVCESVTKSYIIDKTAPTCSVSGGRNTWDKTNVTITGTCNDETSGCESNVLSITKSDNLFNGSVSVGTVKDKAGNETVCDSAYAKIDKIKPVPVIKLESNLSYENQIFYSESHDNRNDQSNQSGLKDVQYKINDGSYTNYSNKVTVLNNTGTATVSLKVTDNAGNQDESTKTIVCNKDIVDVGHVVKDRTFGLGFRLTKSPSGVEKDKYEYVFWNVESTSDTQAIADNKSYNINGKNYSYDRHAVANAKCGDFESYISGKRITTNGRASYSIPNNTNAIYYCFAVRPVRNDRSNLTGIGNYYRSTLYKQSNPNENNTGWTIQYKYAQVGS